MSVSKQESKLDALCLAGTINSVTILRIGFKDRVHRGNNKVPTRTKEDHMQGKSVCLSHRPSSLHHDYCIHTKGCIMLANLKTIYMPCQHFSLFLQRFHFYANECTFHRTSLFFVDPLFCWFARFAAACKQIPKDHSDSCERGYVGGAGFKKSDIVWRKSALMWQNIEKPWRKKKIISPGTA
jgi:hypothetical protein